MAPGFGIVVFNLNGDAAHCFVDSERWDQIVEIRCQTLGGNWKDALNELIGWLTSDDSPEVEQNSNWPDRQGKLLGVCYTQDYVLEFPKPGLRFALTAPLLGIITL